ncbi:oligopeptide transport system ATP-binding protein [Streptomyces sp. SAI-117]|uniref:ABC transporter ATP-binding protein n=1 Tax=Streptomyces sp. SAI-117 TaxID=2940546 RepID=UPI0024758DB1|nr:dipeptide ABC transporter ATP-binding protein [Streptomyces sp. SAI-117]MDH6574194.1 oligopeptide transport system ATP-binding protein [Streptomyces sp. SAI-117]
MSEYLLEARGLKMHFPIHSEVLRRTQGHVKAVDGVDLKVRRGETLALVGESGCGKSTLARLLLRLLQPTAGQVLFEGDDILIYNNAQMTRARRDMQLVFQDPYASLNPRATVGKIIAEPLRVHGYDGDVKARVRELLDMVGLRPEHYDRYPHEFSGGQRQRVGIARAIALRPKLLICDEPISALDVSIQAQIVGLLQDLRSELDLTCVFISHDLSVVRHIADRVAVMYLGKIVEIADRAELYDAPRHPYTESLMSAIPVPDPVKERQRRRIVLTGDLPSPAAPPAGCAFHPRCPRAQTSCSQTTPQLEALGGDRHLASCFFPLSTDARFGDHAADGAVPGHR